MDGGSNCSRGRVVETLFLEKGSLRDLTPVVAFLSKLSLMRRWKVTVCQFQKERTDPQNNALWGVAYEKLAKFTGHTPQELHNSFMRAYFGEIEVEVMGKIEVRPFRTTTHDQNGQHSIMPVEDFSELYELIQCKAAEIGCHISDPDPLLRRKRGQSQQKVAA